MALVRLPGGIWVPTIHQGLGATGMGTATDITLDADEEEVQIIGRVCLAGGSGSKPFGTAGSAVAWLPGASITFADDGASDPTLRVGVKQASSVDAANGPAARATIGAAAFDVYDDLVGGTDTITSTTWREDAMSAGTGFTVSQGDLIAVCFHLDKPGAGAQSVKVRGAAGSQASTGFPSVTLVTSGPTYTTQNVHANIVLKFNDGTLGWVDPCDVFSAVTAVTVGNGNIYANYVRLPFDCKVDAVGAILNPGSGNTTNFDFGLWSDPSTPMTNGTISVDPQIVGVAAQRPFFMPLPAEVSLSKNTDYALGVKQNGATAVSLAYYDVGAAGHLQPNGLDSNTYAVLSTAGGAFAQQNSGLRRALMFVRISQVDDGTGSGGGNANILHGSVVA